VREAALRLRYHPSALARSFKDDRAYSIALAVGDLANPFWAGLAVAAQEEAERHGYMLVVNHTGEALAKERQLLEMLHRKRVDGLILSAAHLKPRDLLVLRDDSRPLVLVDRTIDGLVLPSVVTDNVAGVSLAVDHLVKKGHRRIGFLGGPREITTFRERLEGFRAAIRAHGVRGHQVVSDAAPHPAQNAARRLLAKSPKPTAIIAANLWLTIGVLRAAPEEVEIVGFDDIYLADMLRRPVTTIAHPLEELGRQAVLLLLEVMAHPGTNRNIVLPPRLVVR